MKLCRTLLLLFFLFALPSAAFAQFPNPPVAVTHTAKQTGAWNDSNTWTPSAGQPALPGSAAVVRIPTGFTVTVQHQDAARLRFIRVEGELRLWIHSNTRLLVETLYIAPGGRFTIGASANPVLPTAIAEVMFINQSGGAIDLAWDPKQQSRGMVSEGIVRVFGTPKTHLATMTASAPKGSSTLSLKDPVPVDWLVNDDVVIAGTFFKRFNPSQDERRTITAKSGNSLSLNSVLANDHLPVATDMLLHVAHLTRNVIFRSEVASPLANRGHVMFLSGDVEIQNAAFIDLGRTNKAIPLDDAKFDTVQGKVVIPPAAQILNRRGRYAIHFHQNGSGPSLTTPTSKVYNCVVSGTPGWGFVNHSSNVDFQRNVAYNFAGAGFVTEVGDELGSFNGNIAIRGTGDGVFDKVRVVFQNPNRPQWLSDFAFRGDGFWFQGPALRVKNNVANGCNGAGLIWFTTGAVDLDTIAATPPYGRYIGFPRSWVNTIYAGRAGLATFQPRNWNYNSNQLITSDVPILELDGFDGYGNFIGFRLRFNNHNNVDFYTEDPFNYDLQIVPLTPGGDPKLATRMRQAVLNLRLWNNEVGFNVRYNSRTDWQNVKAVNRLDYDATGAHEGGEFNFQIQEGTFSNLLIDGWEVAGWIENTNTNVRGQISFFAPQTYLNYAMFDIWDTTATCGTPLSPVVSNITSSSARISWTINGTAARYLVRYKISTDQQWRFAQVNGSTTFVNLSGLTSNKQYSFQVIAGCARAPSTWTAAGTFNTL